MAQVRELRPSGKHSQAAAAEVRAWRARLNVPQRELADLLGITQTQVSQRLLGRIPFSVDELGTIAEAWDIELAELLAPPTTRSAQKGPLTRDNAVSSFTCSPTAAHRSSRLTRRRTMTPERGSHLQSVG